jgi:hypothetical protein
MLKRPDLIFRAISSVGRALRLHRRCRRFEPVIAHHFFKHLATAIESTATGTATDKMARRLGKPRRCGFSAGHLDLRLTPKGYTQVQA